MKDIREVPEQDRKKFDALATHPLQSWDWGVFRKNTGVSVVRLGRYEQGNLVESVQMTLHRLPHLSWSIGYVPKSAIPSPMLFDALATLGKTHRCIFLKFEPNIPASSSELMPMRPDLKVSPHPLFTPYTFLLDLTPTESDILSHMHPKTRYNIKIAQKHDVTIQEDNSDEAFETYLRLTAETTARQRFFAHTPAYHRAMWKTMRASGIAHLFTATVRDHSETVTLVSWIVFHFHDTIYYPYGASSHLMRHAMASNLMMWEVIRWGKRQGATSFDMWGALGPHADPDDPWYGFHRFKQGYGGTLTPHIFCHDLILSPLLYSIYSQVHKTREYLLPLLSHMK